MSRRVSHDEVERCARSHGELAIAYERAGNASGAAELRRVENLLWSLARREPWVSVLPAASSRRAPLDPVAVPCRACLAEPGQYCRVMTLLGPCDESILFDSHAQRVTDAGKVDRILGAPDRSPLATRSCAETWRTSRGAPCEHGYTWACPRGREEAAGDGRHAETSGDG